MTIEATYVVVMAGGKGSRLWPLSRPDRPKQFAPLLEGTSLLQATWQRALKLANADHVIVVGDVAHRELLHEQLPDLPLDNLLLEPSGRNTTACIALAAVHARSRDPECVMVVLPADHVILNESEWCDAVRAAAEHASASDRLVAVGVEAEDLDPRFGYHELGPPLERVSGRTVFAVERFVEKPSEADAASMRQGPPFLRNTGTFAWRVTTILEEIDKHQPIIASKILEAMDSADPEALAAAYESLPAVSIDHAVLQNTDRMSVVPSVIERVDVGDFSAFSVLLEPDAHGNSVAGHYTGLDSGNNIIYAPGLKVAMIGVHDYVLVADGDAILVCPLSRTQEIKDLFPALKEL